MPCLDVLLPFPLSPFQRFGPWRGPEALYLDHPWRDEASAAVADRALARQHDEALVRAAGAGVLAAAVDRGAEEVGSGVGARCVDVVVLGEVTHCCGWWVE